MKKTLPILGLFSCISISYAQDFSQTLDSDLNTAPIEISVETQDGLIQALQGLKTMNVPSVNDDLVGAPDYKPAFYNLQQNIELSLVSFTDEINNLYLKIKKDLKRIEIIESTVFNSSHLNDQSQSEIQKTYKKMGHYINKDYKSSMKRLYTLNGFLNYIPVKTKRVGFVDIFKDRIHYERSSLEKLCSTSVCLSKISQDVTEWIKIADSMNNDISLSPKAKISFTNAANQVSNINHFSVALNDFTNSLIRIGLKPNKTYTVSEAAATYLGQIVKSGAGIGVALAVFPAKLINSAFRGIKQLDHTKKFLIKDLTLKRLDTYVVDDASKDLQMAAMELRTNFIFTLGEDEYRQELIKALDLHKSARDYIIHKVLPVDKELKVNIEKYYPEYLFHHKLSFLSLAPVRYKKQGSSKIQALIDVSFDKLNRRVVIQWSSLTESRDGRDIVDYRQVYNCYSFGVPCEVIEDEGNWAKEIVIDEVSKDITYTNTDGVSVIYSKQNIKN